MVKTIVYVVMILLIVGLGLYFELNSGDYIMVERKAAGSPVTTSTPPPAPKK